MQQPSLCTVGEPAECETKHNHKADWESKLQVEPLVSGKVAHEHHPHQMRADALRRRLEGGMPIAGEKLVAEGNVAQRAKSPPKIKQLKFLAPTKFQGICVRARFRKQFARWSLYHCCERAPRALTFALIFKVWLCRLATRRVIVRIQRSL